MGLKRVGHNWTTFTLTFLIHSSQCHFERGTIIISTLWLRKLRFIEVTQLVQGPRANKGLNEDPKPQLLHYIKNFPIVLKIVIYTLEKNEKSKYLWKKKTFFKVEATDIQEQLTGHYL